MKHKRFTFVSGLAGCGKTRNTLVPAVASQLGKGNLVVIVLPSTPLQTEVQIELNKYNTTNHRFNSIIFNRDVYANGVAAEIIEYVTDPLVDTNIAVIMTDEAYKRVAGRVDTSSWITHWDETAKADEGLQVRLNVGHKDAAIHLLNYVEFDMDRSNSVVKLKKGYTAKTELNELNSEAHTLCSLLYSDYADVYFDRKTDDSLYFNIVYKSQMFPDNVTFYAAFMERTTFAFTMMCDPNVTVEVVNVTGGHKNHFSSNIVIASFTDKANSIYMKDNNPEAWTAIADSMIKYQRTTKPDAKVIYIKNDKDPYKYPTEYKQIKNNSAGVNNYKDYDCVMLTTAINPSDSYLNLMKNHYNMTEEQVRWARTTYFYYQIAMRGTIRDTDLDQADSPYLILVPTHSVAKELLEIFPNANHVIADNVVVARKAVTSYKKRACKERKATGVQRTKISKMRKIAEKDPSYYGPVKTHIILKSKNNPFGLIDQTWFDDYMSNGKKKENV